jgi:hypothetical protein
MPPVIQAEGVGDRIGRRHGLYRQHGRRGLLAARDQVVVQAGQFHRPPDLGVDHLGADGAPADQVAAVDQVLDGPPQRRSRHLELVGQDHLAVEAGARRQLPGLDGLLQPLGDLVVHRDGARAVDRDRRWGEAHVSAPGHLAGNLSVDVPHPQ